MLTSFSLLRGQKAVELTVESFQIRDLRKKAGIGEGVANDSVTIIGLGDEAIGGWRANTEDFIIVFLCCDADLLSVEILNVVICC
jgi:hypothetical protein